MKKEKPAGERPLLPEELDLLEENPVDLVLEKARKEWEMCPECGRVPVKKRRPCKKHPVE